MNEVKPVGPERDKQIAELMGQELKPDWAGKYCYCYMTYRGQKCWARLREHSTEFDEAMLLWREIRDDKDTGKISLEVEGWPRVVWANIKCISDDQPPLDGPTIASRGKDEADAISGAYVIWKSGKEGN